MSKQAVCALLGALSLSLSIADLKAITWGEPDGNGHPHVGTVLFQRPSGFFSCTGTLLSPTVMVTAGHCTAGNIRTWVSFDPVITFEGIQNYPNAIAYLDAEWHIGQAIPHPMYGGSSFPDTFDVGLVLLEDPVTLSTYGTLPPLGLLDLLSTGQSRKDRQFVTVGYGLQGVIPPFARDDYARYVGTVSLIEVNSFFLGDEHSAKFTNNPGQGNGSGGNCFGDSGGPVFWGTSNVISAVLSFTVTPCVGTSYSFRLDTATAQDFIRPYLE
jgi:hypothetical protein